MAQEVKEQGKVQKLSYDQFHQKKIEISSTALVLKSSIDVGPFVIVQINGVLVEVPIDPDGNDYTYFISNEELIRNIVVIEEQMEEIFLSIQE